ncbi:EAL domain-containing protein [Lentzea sp. NEAU-D13]|uniref:EAL domain-containing protein n=1 Tax=Lentzea alba TaxID=2714351 RepID=A0A7C9RV30_9PSEU|nr:EAL domain-containing protein [Lentzea alba]NGY63630.1 EAL domain-containing protein [Lentzea alba]
MRSGRPWGQLKGDDPALHDLARYLRGLMDSSDLTSKEVGKRCGCSDSTVSKMLGGDQLPHWDFVAALIEACTSSGSQAEDRRIAARGIWNRAAQSHYRRPASEPVPIEAHAMIVQAQAATISAQQQLLKVTEELSRAHKQLAESAQVEFQASQVILVLQIVLSRLSTLISGLTGDRDRYRAEVTRYRAELDATQRRLDEAQHERGRAETQLDQAQEERRRATALTGEARAKIRLLEERLGGEDGPVGVQSGDLALDVVAPSPDDVLLDMAAGLDRVQRLLDQQDRELTELETERPETGTGTRAGEGTRYRAIFTDSVTGMAVLDLEGRILEVNSALQDMLGLDEREMCGRNVRDALLPGQSGALRSYEEFSAEEKSILRTEADLYRPDGERLWTLCTFSLVRDDHGEPQYQVAMVEDVTDRHLLQNRLRYQALHDPLTGLPNRALLLERLGRVMNNRTEHARAGLCYLDLDGLKVVNDSLGHDVGDQLLVEIGRRLDECASGEGRLVARMGGDEYMILVEGTAGVQDVIDVADRVLAELEVPIRVGGHDLALSASIGIVERQLSGTTSTDLMRDADVTLYWAKADGKARWVLYDPERNAREVARFTMLSSMPRALERGEFIVEYQPMVRLEDTAVLGVEALVRWEHPEFGRLSPDRFIPQAEETGLIVPLGRRVLHRACVQARRWLDEFGARAPFVSVDVSARQLRALDLFNDVKSILDDCALPPHLLQLEITESAITAADHDLLDGMEGLSDLGVRIAIDDFGGGSSNLTMLKHLPVHEVKISGAVLLGLSADEVDPVDAQVVAALVQLAHARRLGVTAVDVETPTQVKRLHRIGCDAGQGWYFARPTGPEDIAELLRGR